MQERGRVKLTPPVRAMIEKKVLEMMEPPKPPEEDVVDESPMEKLRRTENLQPGMDYYERLQASRKGGRLPDQYTPFLQK